MTYKTAAIAATILSLVAIPAIAESGKMIKKVGAEGDCRWFQTTLGTTNQMDPNAYVWSRNDPAHDAWTIIVNNAWFSSTPPTFIIGAAGGEGQDCPATVGNPPKPTRYISTMER